MLAFALDYSTFQERRAVPPEPVQMDSFNDSFRESHRKGVGKHHHMLLAADGSRWLQSMGIPTRQERPRHVGVIDDELAATVWGSVKMVPF